MTSAQNFFRLLGTWALIAFAFFAFNTSATIIDSEAVDSGFGASVTEANSGLVGMALNANMLTGAERVVDGVYTIESEPLEQPLNADPANTSAVPLPAAAWMFFAALFGLVSVARRRQNNES